MKSIFPGYYQPTSEEASALWKECIFVLDANVLLNLYRYTPNTSALFLEILQKVSERLRIPYQAAKEYQVNRLNVISQQSDAYRDIEEFIQKNRDQVEAKLNAYRRHPYINIAQIQSRLDALYENVTVELRSTKQSHPDLLQNDDIRKVLTRLLEGKIGAPFSAEKLKGIYKEGEERFKNNIPPGYMDAKNKDGDQKFGDVVLWFQVLEAAKAENKPVILVTDDAKEDWWWKFRGKIIGPHPLLIEEFQQKVGLPCYMYRSDQFMEYARKYLSQQVDQNSIEEVRNIRQLDEMVLARREHVLQEMQELDHIAKALENDIATVHLQIEKAKQEITLMSANSDIKAREILPYHERLTNLMLRLDTLLGTQQENQRLRIRLREEVQYMDTQREIVRYFNQEQK